MVCTPISLKPVMIPSMDNSSSKKNRENNISNVTRPMMDHSVLTDFLILVLFYSDLHQKQPEWALADK